MPADLRIIVSSLLLGLTPACDDGEPDDSTSVGSTSEGSGGEPEDDPTTGQDDSTTHAAADGSSGELEGSSGDGGSTTGDECPATVLDDGPPASIRVMNGLAEVDAPSAFAELPAWDGEYPVCTVSPTCDGNTAPVLSAALLFLNGAYADWSTPVTAGDRVGVVFPFIDAECNLVGGWSVDTVNGPVGSGKGEGEIDSIPCASGPGLGFDFGQPDVGVTSYSLELTDACGADTYQGGLIVVEA